MPLPQDDCDPDQAAARAAPERNVADLHLKTDRLQLRALTLGDLDELASMLADADGLTYWEPPLSREESRSWIERNLRRYELDGFGRCAVILRSTGELVGDCGLARMLIEGQPVVELGWIVRRTHRGKGIDTEAAAAWRDYAFDTLGLERIVSMMSEKNVASRRVAEKLGMTVEREAIMDGLPHLMYSMRRNRRNRHGSNTRSACRGVRSSGRDVGAASSLSPPGWGCRTADQRRAGWVLVRAGRREGPWNSVNGCSSSTCWGRSSGLEQ